MAEGAWACKMATANSTAARVAAQELSEGGDATSSSAPSTFRSLRQRLAKDCAEKKLLAACVRVEALEKENEARVEALSKVLGKHEMIPKHHLEGFLEGQVFANRKVESEDVVSTLPASTAPEPIGTGEDGDDETLVALASDAGGTRAQTQCGDEHFNVFDHEDVMPNSQAALVQTVLSFQDHTRSCAVSTNPYEATLVGLCALGAERFEAHRACIAKVGEILNATCEDSTSRTPAGHEVVATVPLYDESVARDVGALTDALDRYRRKVAILLWMATPR